MKTITAAIFSLTLIFQSSCLGSHAINQTTPIIPEGQKTEISTTKVVSPTVEIDPTLAWENEEIDFGKERVYILVEAIEDFYEENSEYPTTLDQLVPHFLSSLPMTIYGDPYKYQRIDGFIYIVSFDLIRQSTENRTVTCGYVRVNEVWECSGYSP